MSSAGEGLYAQLNTKMLVPVVHTLCIHICILRYQRFPALPTLSIAADKGQCGFLGLTLPGSYAFYWVVHPSESASD